MKRKINVKNVTRTIKVNTCSCMFVDMTTHSVKDENITITGSYSEKELTDILVMSYRDNKDMVFVKINSVSVDEKLYAISEEDFIKYGHEIPLRNIGKKAE